ncbi:hypothetical protein HMPREF0591_0367 [Mycobacterium parascrofulaceum ATCC BAA-614]|uniref:DNA-binding protein n=1 Tax=Mycobacterium parascrofulaceum ATCC BAA-614 TaxID=525368 RepID=D5P2H3_9MYCO|nr:hypothetical protein [Mycobacterium parascrofulaceum]EFG79746.1 hypothetical protein HMPREF0591_0367 [Mycobacterium parascrofulaceum ATCC BAA-614]
MAVDELDQLLSERFNLHRDDLLAALKTLPAIKPGAAALTEDQARLLDEAGFVEDPVAFAESAADIVAHTAMLINTAYPASLVASLLGINESRVRQRRLARTLWAIENDGAWVYPAIQFEFNLKTGKPDRQIRGLERVFQALPEGLHPSAVAGLLRTPQPQLEVDGRPLSILEWLRSGGSVEPVLELIDIADWAST